MPSIGKYLLGQPMERLFITMNTDFAVGHICGCVFPCECLVLFLVSKYETIYMGILCDFRS
jgi:hypothetical protein